MGNISTLPVNNVASRKEVTPAVNTPSVIHLLKVVTRGKQLEEISTKLNLYKIKEGDFHRW